MFKIKNYIQALLLLNLATASYALDTPLEEGSVDEALEISAASDRVVFEGSPISIKDPEISEIQICFSPNADCEKMLVNLISAATESVKIMAYGFTSAEISEVTKNVFDKDIDVKIIIDSARYKTRLNMGKILKSAGVNVRTDNPRGIAHNKVIIIDNSILITGSYNYTKNASTRNLENIIVLYSSKSSLVMKSYVDYFTTRYEKSTEPDE